MQRYRKAPYQLQPAADVRRTSDHCEDLIVRRSVIPVYVTKGILSVIHIVAIDYELCEPGV
jgi:hypothetical protein